MNNIIKCLITILLITGLTAAQDIDWYNENSDADTFYISNEAELKGLAELVNEKTDDFAGQTIVLNADIDLGGEFWVPIGNNRLSESTRRFRGIFDGNNYSVSNFFVVNESSTYGVTLWQAGLFGYIDAGGQIKNLTVNVLRIVGGEDNGGLAAVYASTMPIENCGVNIKDSISGNSFSGCGTGGLIGRATAELTISNSYSTGKISTKSVRASAGGLVGLASRAITINNSFATGKISASASNYPDTSFAGGLIGQGRDKVEINESFATGNIFADQYNRFTTSSSSGSFAGGLVGCVSSALVINNSFATGDVFATYDVTITSNRFAYSGGLVGRAGSSSNIKNCYSSGVISIKIYGTIAGSFGGIFGRWASGTNTSVYFNSDGATNSAGIGSPAGITKKTPEQLRTKTTFIDWNFNEIWNIKPEINNGFPYLRQFVECKPGEHSFVWSVTTPATCEINGEEAEICSKCGAIGETRAIEAIGHNWGEWGDWEVIESANCTEPGTKTRIRICQNDNAHIDTETEIIPIDEDAHDWDNWSEWEVIIPATCTEHGIKTRTRICLNDNTHVDTETENIPIDEDAHDWNDWVKTADATCIAKEQQERTCKINPEHKETREVGEPLGHDWSKLGTEITPATCEVKSIHKAKCSICGEEHDELVLDGNFASNCDGVSIKPNNTQNGKYGIKIMQNPAKNKAEMKVFLPNDDKTVYAKIVIYDMTGNVVFNTTTNGVAVWDLRNNAGRFVANGAYLVIAEIEDANGVIYHYSVKFGVKR